MSQGCGVKDIGEAEKEVVAYDPSFQKTLDNRDALRGQLESARAEYLGNTEQINSQMEALRERKAQVKKDYTAAAEKIKKQIDPEKRQLQRDLMEYQRQYKIKAIESENVEKDIKEITALIGKKEELDLTQEEIRTWNDRLTSLIRKKEKLSSEKDKIRQDIDITKLKDKVLRL
jgi:chromosome segregation ATPase